MKKFSSLKKIPLLSLQEKETMWDTITTKIKVSENSSTKNVRIDAPTRLMSGRLAKTPSFLSSNHKYMVIASKIFATLLIGSLAGASALAEQSLPGDTLYNFKVHVNESVRGAFAVGAESNAKWELKKLERRTEEKSELETKARITPRAQAIIITEANASSEKAHEALLKLRTQGKSELAASLETTLNESLQVIHANQNGLDSRTEKNTQATSKRDTNASSKSNANVRLNTRSDEVEEKDTTVSNDLDLEIGNDVDKNIKNNTLIKVKSVLQ